MNGNFQIIFCEDLGLTIELLQGDIFINDLVEMLKIQVFHPAYKPTNNVLTDVRKAKLHISGAEMESLAKYVGEHGFLQVKKKVALLTKEPNHVVASTLFSLNMKDTNSPQLINVYSTTEAVINWLGLPWSTDEYEELVSDPSKSKYKIMHSVNK